MPQKDDYLECLHHTKEVRVSSLKQLARAHTIQEHTIKRQAEESRRAREEAKKGGVAGPRLGLIQIDSDDAQGDSADNAKSS